jgi:hypothetical protein
MRCASFRLAALIGDRVRVTVVWRTPASTRSATWFKRSKSLLNAVVVIGRRPVCGVVGDVLGVRCRPLRRRWTAIR